MLVRTLLFLGVVGLHRPWDLRSYTGDALSVLTGRLRAYGYFHTERFLAQVAQAGGAETFTDGLAQWTARLWNPPPAPTQEVEPLYYIDGHRKPVYADALIPIVTTAATADAVTLAQTYGRRWPAQENIIRDYLLALGLDTNHGYAKRAVVNSEVAKRRTALEQRLATLRRWTASARVRYQHATALSDRLRKQAKARGETLYRGLNERMFALEEQGTADYLVRREIKERKATIDAELQGLWQRIYRVEARQDQDWRKQERYCRKPREVLRALEDLACKEREMFELDNRKDQVMTICKVALVNLVMWTRDQYFPLTYAHATWKRLAPFFHLPGRVTQGPGAISVELRPFNDRQLNHDLVALCERVNQASPRLPDGRQLLFSVSAVFERQQRRPDCTPSSTKES
jgi:hypothetical protein